MYLWYSEKQKDIVVRTGGNSPILGMIYETGKIVEYTEATQEDRPAGSWDDYVFVGEGDFFAPK